MSTDRTPLTSGPPPRRRRARGAPGGRGPLETCGAVVAGLGDVARGSQSARDEVGEPAVVFDHQDVHGPIVAGQRVDEAILTTLLPSSERSRTMSGEYPEHANGPSELEDPAQTGHHPSRDVSGQESAAPIAEHRGRLDRDAVVDPDPQGLPRRHIR